MEMVSGIPQDFLWIRPRGWGEWPNPQGSAEMARDSPHWTQADLLLHGMPGTFPRYVSVSLRVPTPVRTRALSFHIVMYMALMLVGWLSVGGCRLSPRRPFRRVSKSMQRVAIGGLFTFIYRRRERYLHCIYIGGVYLFIYMSIIRI
jgi:hypothetical protein